MALYVKHPTKANDASFSYGDTTITKIAYVGIIYQCQYVINLHISLRNRYFLKKGNSGSNLLGPFQLTAPLHDQRCSADNSYIKKHCNKVVTGNELRSNYA